MSTESHDVDTSAEVAGTEADKINTGALGTLVAVGLFAMISITAAVTALVRHDLEAEEALKDANANQVVTDLKAAQRNTLNSPPGYVDRGKGTVTLPIEIAKGLVVSELGKDPNSATPPAAAKPAASEVAGGGSGGTLASGGAASGGAANGGGAATSGGAANDNAATGKAGAAGKPEDTKGAVKPEQGREIVKSGGSTTSIVSKPTPTAATPGAASPGPTNK
jgi:hypothetical protein